MGRHLTDQAASRIQEIIVAQLRGTGCNVKNLAIDSSILGRGLGLDSLEALALVTAIEAEFDIVIDDDELTVGLFETIGTLATCVQRKMDEKANT